MRRGAVLLLFGALLGSACGGPSIVHTTSDGAEAFVDVPEPSGFHSVEVTEAERQGASAVTIRYEARRTSARAYLDIFAERLRAEAWRVMRVEGDRDRATLKADRSGIVLDATATTDASASHLLLTRTEPPES